MPQTEDALIRRLLDRRHTLAMVGASDKPERDSNIVLAFLLAAGYRVLPVNPQLMDRTIHGQRVAATLRDIAEPVHIVDIFRKPADVPAIVEEAIAIGAKAVWMQLGVVHEAAAARARAAGLEVVMDRCPKIEIARLGL